MEGQPQSAEKENKEAHPFELGQQRYPKMRLKSGETGQLNPEWLEWFMGWPMGWTAFEPLETGKCQEWLRWHG